MPGPVPAFRETVVDVPGARLRTRTQGVGPPLVLCHGGPGLCDNLGPLAGLLDDIATVHRYDQRGNGKSSHSGPFDVATFVADLDALRRHWGYEQWVVGGHSWGAALALFYAAAHPERTRGVICVSPTGARWGWQDGVRRHRLGRLRPDERDELARLEALMGAGEAGEAERSRFLRLMWSTDFVSREQARRILDAGPLYPCERNDNVFRAVADDQRRILDGGFAHDIRRLASPVLVVQGAGDADPTRGTEIADLVPSGLCVTVPGVGHSPWLEDPTAVRSAIVAFLGAQSASTVGAVGS